MKSLRPLNKVFKDANNELATLVTRTQQLKRLTHQLRKHLPTELAPHCYVGSTSKNSLTILVDSAAWATQLRFITPALLEELPQLNPIYNDVKRIQVKLLTPKAYTSQTVISRGPQMNQENAKGIETLAENIEDQNLQQALKRLARHASKDK